MTSEDKNHDWEFVGPVVEHSKETIGESLFNPATNDWSTVYAEFNSHHDAPNFYAQAHEGPVIDDNQISLDMEWDELEANQYQYGEHDL